MALTLTTTNASYCGGCSKAFDGTYLFPFEGGECDLPLGLRAFFYALILVYLFLGVAMASDVFMGAIETITSSTKTVRLRSGAIKEVLVWNGTVANLSLMALGSSAPEILLSCVELLMGGFKAGDLGPNTIVGSAAFNLFMITAICMTTLPTGEIRLIKDLRVFALTTTFSLVAYLWLALIVAFISPGVVEVWEAVLTFLGFPALIGGAYAVDRGFCHKSYPKVSSHDGADSSQPEPPPSPPSSSDSPASPTTGGLLKGRVLAVQNALNSASPRLDDDVPAVSSSSSSPLKVIKSWGKSAGVLSEEQITEMNLAHLKKAYKPRTLQVQKRENLLVLTGSAPPQRFESAGNRQASPSIPVTIATPTQQKHSVLAHARSAKDVVPPKGDEELSEPSRMARDGDDEETYLGTLKAAFLVNGGDEEHPATAQAWIGHIISMPWKLFLAAANPPATVFGGYPCFVSSIGCIGFITFLVDEVATMFGCCCGLPSSITAITFVALGTSLPDTFASRTAALNDDYADDSVGNVTGSNSVNVFLGIGLPWLIGAVYWRSKGEAGMPVRPCELGFAVVVFLSLALVAVAILAWRRYTFGYELGGKMKIGCGLALVTCWLLYLLLAILQATDTIKAVITTGSSCS